MDKNPFSSVQFSCSVLPDSLRPHGLQHTRPPCPSPTPGACSNSCPSSRWCHPTISSSVIPFSSMSRAGPEILHFYQTARWVQCCRSMGHIFLPCEILVPQPGIKPMPPSLGAQSFNHWTTREVPFNSKIPDRSANIGWEMETLACRVEGSNVTTSQTNKVL